MRGWLDLVLLIGYTLGTVGGVVFMKEAIPGVRSGFDTGVWQVHVLVAAVFGGLLYIAGAVLWLLILSRNELSLVYPLAVGATILTSTVAAMLFFGETPTIMRLGGCALILAGAVFVAYS